MASTAMGGHAHGLFSTMRKDAWWVGPLLTVLGFGGFVVYTTWAGMQGVHYFADPYLSPLYSPTIFTVSDAAGAAPISHAWFGEWPDWLRVPSWVPFGELFPLTPAIFILVFPAAFRGTCYYYRKAYYRSVFAHPPGCAVGAPPRKGYLGEAGLLVLQNVHRFAMYFALVFIGVLYYDAFIAFFKQGELGVGVGSIVLLVNATLLAGYTFGCHSLRHLIGGRKNCFTDCTASKVQHAAWKKVSWLNSRHMAWAWISLFWVGFTDVYVRLVSMGVITDINTWD